MGHNWRYSWGNSWGTQKLFGEFTRWWQDCHLTAHSLRLSPRLPPRCMLAPWSLYRRRSSRRRCWSWRRLGLGGFCSCTWWFFYVYIICKIGYYVRLHYIISFCIALNYILYILCYILNIIYYMFLILY